MTKLFGTDGIRGPFGPPPLDPPTVLSLGFHLGSLLRERHSRSPVVVIGGDTRNSTPILCRWLAAGLSGAAADVRFLGILPTPAIAWAVRRYQADTAIAVSASHNLHPDNGIKLIDARGLKWTPSDEALLEQRVASDEGSPNSIPDFLLQVDGTDRDYLRYLSDSLERTRPLDGLRIVLDAANGAASGLAGRLFQDQGADALVLSAQPDGKNINRKCGSTHPEALCRTVVETKADLGIAFDGDADRALLVDEKGELRDGDQMLYLWARDLLAAGELDPPRIVATSMSNLGLERALATSGISVRRCDVGDRHVVAAMREEGLALGGEQSGHIVNARLSTTGDGLLTALHMAAIVADANRPLSELLDGFRRFPQILVNVPVRKKPSFESLPAVQEAARTVEETLSSEGRLVLRYSGTEPLARIMIEGPDRNQIEEMAESIAVAIRNQIGRSSP